MKKSLLTLILSLMISSSQMSVYVQKTYADSVNSSNKEGVESVNFFDKETYFLDNTISEVVGISDESKEDSIDLPNKPTIESSNTTDISSERLKESLESSEDSDFTNEDFKYGSFQYKGRMKEEISKFAIIGFSSQGEKKVEKNRNLVIPKEVVVNGELKQIEGISKSAFEGIRLDSVVFPKTDKNIEFVIMDSAFKDCNLKDIKFNEGLISIESYAFKNNLISSVYIPSTVWKIGNEAFNSNEIDNLDISDDVYSIQMDNYSFSNNRLSNVNLPYSIFKIRDYVFRDNTGYNDTGKVRLETRNPSHLSSTTYIVPKNDYHEIILVTKVDRDKLWNKIQQSKDIVRDWYKIVDLNKFDDVLASAKEVFKNKNSTQGEIDTAFNNLTKAEEDLKASSPDRTLLMDTIRRAEELVEDMFTPESYDNMKKELEKSKRDISNPDATSDEIEKSRKNLEKAIDSLVINENAVYRKDDFTYNGNTITGFSSTGREKSKINKNLILPDKNPDGVDIEVIGKDAFSLEGDSGVSMGSDTVSSKNGMESVILPKKIRRIEQNAFRLNNFREVKFPKTLEYIGESAFNGNKLEKVVLPNSVNDVEAGAFSLNQIVELRLSPNMKEIKSGSFSRNIYLKKLVIPEGIKYIGKAAFQGSPLNQLLISSTVEKIDNNAFSGHQLQNLVVPGNVKVIGDNAFAHNIKWRRLKELTIKEGVEEIGKSAFRYSLLSEVKLTKSIKKLHYSAFKDAQSQDKKDVVVKLYTSNRKHLEFNSEKSLKNQQIIFKEELPRHIYTIGDSIPSKMNEIHKKRIDGIDRYETAVNISKEYFKKSNKVVLVSGKNESDILIASTLASKENIPILLIKKESIPQNVLKEIMRLGAKEAIIIGGENSIKNEAVKDLNLNITRLAGRDRYETAVKIAESSGNTSKIVIVNGKKLLDGILSSTLTVSENRSIILVDKEKIPNIARKIVENSEDILIVGGVDSIHDSAIRSTGKKYRRLSGKNRYETAVKIAEESTKKTKKAVFVNEKSYVDAVVYSSVLPKTEIPILPVKKETIPKEIKDYIEKNMIEELIFVGGKNSLSEKLI